ncbi:MAG TPA: type IV secretory system conjugative DNA transfer family protein [Candidatus Obscuribacter sp.]|nr:type IV secretory system conjugative DNA transfer family protein [Candidatus Obscuribacter sp.]HMX44518.1 type IV secretory system conjugative DNA transfer family protein [Candidatus Obscuribacter sp.]HND06771.1 type IV secretory system conjugative DNA transfer family protein [Candidatus Obscuribacter sp.]HNN61390.1 type IV secretory system conjugative DNA transfer family protein [Candidatus Obscuribacter sp.]
MALTAKVVEVVALPPGEFPRVAVNAMVSLQYRSEIFDEVDSRLVFYDDAVESYGMDTWRCRYQAILNWREHEAGLELEVKVKEKNYGDTHIDTCVERAEKIVLEIIRGAERSRGKPEPDVPWKAKFASKEDLLESGFFVEPMVQPEAGSLLVGKYDDQRVWLSRDMKVRHVLVCGPTGCGKSTSIFIPNLIERLETSAIVTEASPGSRRPVLYGATAGWRAENDHRVIYFNPDDICTMRFNPVDLVRTFDDAQMVAGLIVSNTTPDSHMGDQIWSQAETHLLQALLLHAAGLRHDLYGRSTKGDGANLASIRRLLRTGPHGMVKELEGTRLAVARAEYEAFLNNSSPNFRFGVVSGLLARLSIFANPKVAAATEVTDFSLEELSKELFTMYLAVPVHRPDFLPLAALAFNFIFTFVLSKLDELKHPLTLYLDEFTNYGAIPGIGRYLTVIRNAGVGAVLGVQDLAQLELVYKDKLAQILWSQPRTKILFPPADDRMAERISKMLGLGTEQEVVAASGNLSNRQFPRPLIEPSDLMRLEKEGKYLVLSTTNPAKLDRLKSWQTYPSQTSLPPPPVPPLVVEDLEEMSRKESYGGRAEKDGEEKPGGDVTKEQPGKAGAQADLNVTAEGAMGLSNEGRDSLEGDDQGVDARDHDEPEGDFWSQLRGKFG